MSKQWSSPRGTHQARNAIYITIKPKVLSGNIMKSQAILAGVLLAYVCFTIQFADCSETKTNNNASLSDIGKVLSRQEKFISLFSIVRFSNSPCTGTNSYNGTCLTSSECSSYGGTGSGTCASGFGVCCIVSIQTCGKTAQLNNTYWQNPGYPSSYTASGQCSLYVEKMSSNICQLRLDFVEFNLAQPDSSALTTTGQCLTDQFTVSGAANNVPTICGFNDKQHMYIHMTPGTNTFTINILTSGTSTQRTWNILIRQIPCGTTYTAPDNCLQWFTEPSGTLVSYNYQYAATPLVQHLAYQDYNMCLRANQGFCGVKYAICSSTIPSYGLTDTTPTSSLTDGSCTTDWIQIPCASDNQNSITTSAPAPNGCASKICGNIFQALNPSPAAAVTTAPVYTYSRPFEVRFYTNSNEATAASATNFESIGFCLSYVMQPCTSTSSG